MLSRTVNVITALGSTTTQLTKLVTFAMKYTLTVPFVLEEFTLLLVFHVRQVATLISLAVVSSVQATLRLVIQHKTLLPVSLLTLLSTVLVSVTKVVSLFWTLAR